MTKLAPKAEQFWRQYLASLPEDQRPTEPTVRANFCGSREIADELLHLYLSGKKTAGSGLVKDYESAGDPLPQVGDYWIILDSSEEPRCIAQVIRVEIHRFRNIPAEVAKAEGEGDGSVKYWSQVHAKFFAPYLAGWGIVDLEDAEVVTEFFKILQK